ncbi:MotA/TolQ/ExbB proton channel family protein [Ketobacter sp.]|uniref:MotA/TolQ/ExbB proton channel family protein n=1 Tax=Ketobacter sp. TaxID=2083498 RepID=UPI000F12B10F|nr:MotA/TolQ/ExbB proton channel family protein [Ketobacter sp.]RLU01063.1 MAG: MotA/TolQ/ExbB proton channel family protein [Ketobacter sp.]
MMGPLNTTLPGLAMGLLLSLLLSLLLLAPRPVVANTQSGQPSLQQLLDQLKQERAQQRAQWQAREQRFLAEQKDQQRKLEQARSAKLQQEQSLQPLQAELERVTAEVRALEDAIARQGQQLRALQGTFSRIAGETAASLQQSPVSLQFPQRSAQLQRLAALADLPTVEDLEALWLITQEEMTAAGRVVQFDGQFVDGAGRAQTAPLTRVGTFTVFAAEGFLQYLPETQELLRPAMQPPARYLRTVEAASPSGAPGMAIRTWVVDPTRGALIRQLGHSPALAERVAQAGWIGVIILALGGVGALLALWRIGYLLWVTARVNAQLKQLHTPSAGNPLGRVLLQAGRVRTANQENYQFKLDEMVLAELPALERGQNFIKLLAAVAPLLGLLGTVTGMILTFQSISLFGNGDPKLMAGGISQALMTTVLGLVVAIPLLFSHSFVVSLSRNLVQRLDEQSAGLLAARLERTEAPHE